MRSCVFFQVFFGRAGCQYFLFVTVVSPSSFWRFCMFAKRLIAGVVAGVFLTQLVGCGTIMYPERKGQRDGKLDPAIVVLDAIGLLFFIVPGVIAFAADFSNGTIYLPGGKHAGVGSVDAPTRVVYLGDQINDSAAMARVLSDAAGQSIDAKQIKLQERELTTVALLQ
jgi:hypothetical protein